MASSSNDNTSRCEYKVNETVKIEIIESEINDSDILDMTFNGEDIRNIAYPIVVEKGEIVEFASKPKVSRNDVRRYNYYDVNKSMRFIDANGQEQNQGVYNLRYTPYFDYWDILRIIKSNE